MNLEGQSGMIQIGRREFLFRGLATTCVLGTCRTWAQAATPPSKTITMAIIGIGARGSQMLPIFLNQPGVRFLAVCDAVRERREALLKAAGCFDKMGQAARAETLRSQAKMM